MIETDLAAKVIAHLRGQGWEIYQEVEYRGRRADIVATLGRFIRIVECKTRYSVALVQQAYDWRGWAHFVDVAYPYTHSRGHEVLDLFCAEHGIGRIEVGRYSDGAVQDGSGPRLDRKAIVRFLRGRLCEEHKTFCAAGSPAGGYYSPWQQTCRLVREDVAREPGVELRVLLDRINHHYVSAASARCAMAKWIRAGSVTGVRLETEGRKLRLYPREAVEK